MRNATRDSKIVCSTIDCAELMPRGSFPSFVSPTAPQVDVKVAYQPHAFQTNTLAFAELKISD